MFPLFAFADELEKIAEDALGIPDRERSHELPKVKGRVWQFGVHDHLAERRGRHFDLRLGDPATGHAHSWALPPRLPAPGEALWAIQQPTHSLKYMDFKGSIPSGYGAGKVDLHDRNKAEVLRSSPGHIAFNVYDSKGTREFVLHRIDGKKWKLFNRTPTRESLNVPTGKPRYKEMPPEKADLSDDRYLMSAKIDDAHNLFVLPGAGEPVRVVSHRAPTRVRHSDLIDHSAKLQTLSDVRVPAGLGDTVLRGGVYGHSRRSGSALPAEVLGGLLNADVWKSRTKQKELGTLVPVLYDVERYRGKDVSKAPYDKKLAILRKVVEAIPSFRLPPMAETAAEKKALLSKIEKGKLPETHEGVVLWKRQEYEPPTKVKFREESDVYIRGFFPAERGSKYEGHSVGGFTYAHSPDGPVVGRVGTGLSDAQRRDMQKRPEAYLGTVATVAGSRVSAKGSKFKTTAIRAPAFLRFHVDKNADRYSDLLH